MKRIMLVVLFALLAVAMASAQAFIPSTDVLGAHNNGGRGLRGLPCSHSGGRGNGGDLVAGSGVNTLGGAEGDYHLWGQDVSLITQETLQFGGGFGKRRRWLHCQLCCRPVDSFVPASNFGHRFLPELP